MRYKHDMTGPKTREEWIEAYEERGNEYMRSPKEREKMYLHRVVISTSFYECGQPACRTVLEYS
jgi:hypothetical protein